MKWFLWALAVVVVGYGFMPNGAWWREMGACFLFLTAGRLIAKSEADLGESRPR